jgi:hypothetical protein
VETVISALWWKRLMEEEFESMRGLHPTLAAGTQAKNSTSRQITPRHSNTSQILSIGMSGADPRTLRIRFPVAAPMRPALPRMNWAA